MASRFEETANLMKKLSQKGFKLKNNIKTKPLLNTRMFTKNLEKAIKWIIREMKKDGISNVRGDRVRVPVWIRGDESIELIKPYKKKLNTMGIGGSVSTPKGGIKGEVIVVNDYKDLKKTSKNTTTTIPS